MSKKTKKDTAETAAPEETSQRASISSADITAALKAAAKAKESDFEVAVVATDMWEPENPGDSIVGVYLGSEVTKARTHNHYIGVDDGNGGARQLMLPRARNLTKQMNATAEEGRIVKVVFVETRGPENEGGRAQDQYRVFWLKT